MGCNWQVWAICVLAGTANGCILIPTRITSTQDDGTHRTISGELLDQLHPGRTSKQETTRIVGRRDVELAGGKVWVYSWETRQEWRFVLLTSEWGGPIKFDPECQIHYLLMEFDDADVLLQKRIRHGGYLNGLAKGMEDAMRE